MPKGIYPHGPWTAEQRVKILSNPNQVASQFQKGHIGYKGMLGKKNPSAAKQLLVWREAGHGPWNKGLTKEDPRILKQALKLMGRKIPGISGDKSKTKLPEVREKIRLKAIGRKLRPDVKAKVVTNLQAYYKTHPRTRVWLGKHLSEEHREKIRLALKGKMPKNVGMLIRPSQQEFYLDAILQLNFPHEWRYVGDGKLWIDRKNPDFVNANGKKLVIEYNGYYKHTIQKDNAKAEHYARYGFRTLNLYPPDLREDIIVEKVQQWLDKDMKW